MRTSQDIAEGTQKLAPLNFMACRALIGCPQGTDHLNAIGTFLNHEIFLAAEFLQGRSLKGIERARFVLIEVFQVRQVLADINDRLLMAQDPDQFEPRNLPAAGNPHRIDSLAPPIWQCLELMGQEAGHFLSAADVTHAIDRKEVALPTTMESEQLR